MLVLFSIAGCQYCRKAKVLLDTNRLPLLVLDAEEFADLYQNAAAVAQHNTLPLIFLGRRKIGGYDQLVSWVESGSQEEKAAQLGPELVSQDVLQTWTTAASKSRQESTQLPDAYDAERLVENALDNAVAAVLSSSPSSAHLNDLIPLPAVKKMLKQANGSSSLCPGDHVVASQRLRRSLDVLSERSGNNAARRLRDITRWRCECALLQLVDLAIFSPDEKLAFLINMYNGAVRAAMIVWGRPGSDWARYRFFTRSAINIGEYSYSLDDLENGLLRANSKSPMAIIFKPFSAGDPRTALAMQHIDYRVHAALNCGAASCPPLRTFSAENIQNELRVAADTFFGGTTTADTKKGIICASKILDWYAVDFAPNIVSTIVKHLSPEAQSSVKEKGEKFSWKWVFHPYDWGTP